MKKALKWTLIGLGGIFGLLLIVIIGIFIYLNYQGEMTTEQKNSIDIIGDLSHKTPNPEAFSGTIPDDKPEIYDDQKEPEKIPTGEVNIDDEDDDQ